ncbi:MAG: glycosyltransferase [Rhizobiaceae bacterium]|nr:glycosyltransferase [Rhizobiaceae bacterium]
MLDRAGNGSAVGEAAAHQPSTIAAGAWNVDQRQSSAQSSPQPSPWRRLGHALGIAPADLAAASARCRTNGTSIAAELIAAQAITEEGFCRALAQMLDLPFLERVEPALIVMRRAVRFEALAKAGDLPPVFYYSHEVPLLLIAPINASLADLVRMIEGKSELRHRMRIVTPTRLRRAIQARSQASLMREAVCGLADAAPSMSARTVLAGRQGFVLGLATAGLLTFAALDFGLLATILHVGGSLAFLACVLLRVAAAMSAKPLKLARFDSADPGRLPIYSVLVALRNEAEIVPELLVALGKLDWPRAKLEIKLICESDDPATRAALAAHELHPCVEVLVVPAGNPRTKPKALAFALPQCKGEFVVLYDAEDRPHPMQLREAWDRFSRSDGDLACLQAPLVISRSRALLPRLFALEYAALFRGLLPRLAAWKALIPLGGTSNHFRRDALEAVGGWDPYNVTEDADLGLRLTRCGYRIGMITRPTHEAAPADYETWLPQRTRWFKGWMQTWLVHMRAPRELMRDLGLRNFVLMQILFAGMVVSALAHVFFVVTIIALATILLLNGNMPTHHAAILALDIFNVAAGYAAFLVLGRRALAPSERPGFWKVAIATPLYWLALSHGAWRAVWHLIRRPHHWEKTPHPPTRKLVRRETTIEFQTAASAAANGPLNAAAGLPSGSPR